MDPLTHALAGAAIARVAEPAGVSPRAALLTTMAAALAPDLDYLLLPIRGEHSFFLYQGTFTHALVALAVGPLIIAGIARALSKGKGSLRGLWLLALFGFASHLLLDVVSGWGIAPLAPWDKTRVVWPLLYSFDVVVWALLLVPWVVVKRRKAPAPRAFAVSLGAVVVWAVGVCGVSRALVAEQALELADQQAVPVESVSVWPASPLWPHHRLVVMRTSDSVYLAWPAATEALVRRPTNLDDKPVKAILDLGVGKAFLRFAAEPVARVGMTHSDHRSAVVELSDQRFQGGPHDGPWYAMVFDTRYVHDDRAWKVDGYRWRFMGSGDPLPSLETDPPPEVDRSVAPTVYRPGLRAAP